MKATNNITIEEVTVNNSIEFIYLIDGVYNQQKGFKTEKEAIDAANSKIKETKTYKKK